MTFPMRAALGAADRPAAPAAAAAGVGGWTPAAGKLPAPAYWGQPDGAAVLLDKVDDKRYLLLAGGENGKRDALGNSTLYDVDAGTCTPTSPLWTARRLHTITKLDSGKVLVTGGIAGPLSLPATPITSAEIYDPVARKWTPVASMNEARYSHSATKLPDGRVLVAGGCALRSPQTHRALRTAEIYDPGTDQWTPTKDPMIDARFGHPAVLLTKNNKVLLAGGIVSAGIGQYAPLGYCELFDVATGTWAPTGSLASPRKGHQATQLKDGTVLVSGGDIATTMSGWSFYPYSQQSCERYHPDTGAWAPDTDMPWGRSHHRAVCLESGKVLVIGGTDDGTFDAGFPNATLYDPAAKTWTDTAGMTVGRWVPAAAVLPGDKVAVAGGIVRSGASAPTIGEDLLTDTVEVFTP
ncbi:Galactose oxidase, central domain [Amycolatopsis xylanica]|uniref:Galactose oxidase, central domain n=1 Tax=Amycolatopsis xylanica TaxID=589385 RepID=A0A1H3RFK7_9PSEU|nr:kelch repeat-containing protein [Amycolatopsis xylanica]SDZ23729.1 Galactose oxidase, central domain [Amycolatopsis xylanica]